MVTKSHTLGVVVLYGSIERTYLNVVIGLDSAGGVVDILAADKGDRLALEQSRDRSGNDRVLHFALKFVKKYA